MGCSEPQMIALIQRVTSASVTVDGEPIAAIGPGMLALVAVEHGDGTPEVERMADRLVKFRLFADSKGRMNLDLEAAGGEVLIVPQFTLAADTTSGHRPSFSGSAAPEIARAVFADLCRCLESRGQRVGVGRFGAEMQVASINDGPVTFRLEVRDAG
jgi:D-tyrosyl-tRNA(Tyr) deacylase